MGCGLFAFHHPIIIMKPSSVIRTGLLVATLLLSACGPGSPPGRQLSKVEVASKTEPNHEAEVERQLRVTTEARLERQEAATGRYQNLSLVISVGLVVALLCGIILGSQARHEAGKETTTP